jgi:hypothetical protein
MDEEREGGEERLGVVQAAEDTPTKRLGSLTELSDSDESERKKRKTQFRFWPARDIALLKETISINPWGPSFKKQEDGWNAVTTKMVESEKWDVKVTTIRNRVNLLLTTYQSKNTESLKKSGTDEEYDERDALMDELMALKEAVQESVLESKQERVKRAKREVQLIEDAERIKEAAMRGITPFKRQKKDRNGLIEALQTLIEDKQEASKTRLEIEKQKLEVERKDKEEKNRIAASQVENDKARLALEQAKLDFERSKWMHMNMPNKQ